LGVQYKRMGRRRPIATLPGLPSIVIHKMTS
jgi:hypothetical protein